MTISRDAIAVYLDEQFSALAASVGQDVDRNVGYSPDIKNALRTFGTSEGDLLTVAVEDSDREDVFALAEFYAARRLWRLLGDRVNTSTGKTSYNFQGQRDHAKAIMDNAAAVCTRLGYEVSANAWGVGHLNLDWAEAEAMDA